MGYHIGIKWYHLIFLNYLNLKLRDISFSLKSDITLQINMKTVPCNFTIYSVYSGYQDIEELCFGIAKSVLDIIPP